MRVLRGFPNIDLVRDALGVLVPAIKRGQLPPPSGQVWDGWRGFPVGDPIIGVQHLAKRIASVYSLQVGLVLVSFLEQMKEAGRIELGSRAQDEFHVELRSEFKTKPRVLSAILAHELAHVFLHRHGLPTGGSLAAEIITDTTAVIYGFGALMADTYVVTETREAVAEGTLVRRSEQHLGYLTPDEMGYALTRAGFGAVDQRLESHAARRALEIGRARAGRELTCPPLRSSHPLRAWWYRVLRWWAALRDLRDEIAPLALYGFQPGKVVFRCTVCCQGIRLPTRARVTATCPRCETELPCDT